MALPGPIQTWIDYFRSLNNNAYNGTTNPGGLAQGGHRQNFVPTMGGMADVTEFVAGQAEDAAASAVLTAEDASNTAADRIATSQNVTATATNVTLSTQQADRSEGEADRAQGYADGLNLPSIASGAEGDVLTKTGGVLVYGPNVPNGSVTFPKLDSATIASQSEAQTGTEATKLMTPQRVNQAIQTLSPKPGLVPIGNRVIVSSPVSAIDFSLPSGYKEFLLRFWNLNVFQSGQKFAIRTSADGVNFNNDSSAYQSYQLELRANVSAAVNSGTRTSAAMFLTISNTPYDPPPTQNSGHIRILNAKEEAETAIICESIFRIDSSTVVPVFGGGSLNSKEITSAIRLLAITTQITSGSAQLYGVPN